MKVAFHCGTTNKVLEMLCEPSDKVFSIRSAGLQLVVSQLDTFCSTEQLDALIQEHDELKCGVDDSNQEVKEHVEEVERIRRAAMFSGRFRLLKTDDNCYFIDSNGVLWSLATLWNCGYVETLRPSLFTHTTLTHPSLTLIPHSYFLISHLY